VPRCALPPDLPGDIGLPSGSRRGRLTRASAAQVVRCETRDSGID
jgi:hypothetical protein